ncbi:MAG: helix-turn-helix transcriptional regulator [Pseudomonas sp.]
MDMSTKTERNQDIVTEGYADMALRIRDARKAAGLTQSALAARLHVHRATVAHWERDTGFAPGIEHLRALSRELQVGFEWLALGDEAGQPRNGTQDGMQMNSRRELESRLMQLSRHIPTSFLATIVALIESASTYLE